MYCTYCGAYMVNGASFCPSCGGKIDAQPVIVETAPPIRAAKVEKSAKPWRVVSGILTLIVAALALLSACGAVVPSTTDNVIILMAGFLGAALMVAAGIVSIATSARSGRIYNAVLIILYSASMLACCVTIGAYLDLGFCGLWCGVCACVESILAALK